MTGKLAVSLSQKNLEEIFFFDTTDSLKQEAEGQLECCAAQLQKFFWFIQAMSAEWEKQQDVQLGRDVFR